MKTYTNPLLEAWPQLIARPTFNSDQLTDAVQAIIQDVKRNKDKALIKYARMFDGVNLSNLTVSSEEINEAEQLVPQELKNAIHLAYKNISAFHAAQQSMEISIETTPGVQCWRKPVAIEKVGLYIPAGSAPLFSTILMLGIPAKLAGCKEVVLCAPPNANRQIHPVILYTASLVGITQICKVGGAQAVAAMAFGTESIPKVDKIFGPGNQYVTKAKELVQQAGVAIDLPAGPSEVLVIADDTCNPAFVAADLLSQAEHGADSQVILVSDSNSIAQACLEEINKQVSLLPRKGIIKQSLVNSKTIVFDSLDMCVDFSNQYAPEHLIIASKNADQYADRVINAGSVFLGNYSCEALGDYASGTNHTLPTNGSARSYGGVSLESFVKKITYQRISTEGMRNLGKAVTIMAEAEGLKAHSNAVSIRLKHINLDKDEEALEA